MPINVTENDKKIETLVHNFVCQKVDRFKSLEWVHNSKDLEVFDFDGFYFGKPRCRLDVKTLYCDKDKYEGNIFSIDKYNDFVKNNALLEYYIAYYYPYQKYVRLYDLDKATIDTGFVRVYHKRELQEERDKVAFIRSADKVEFFDVELDTSTLIDAR